MKRIYLFIITFLFLFACKFSLNAQEPILDNAGKYFKKEERKNMPKLKSRYYFEISENTGREYLKQQDIVDAQGQVKSSGIFADDGNKITDVRYKYDANGKLERKEEKMLGGGDKIITLYNSQGYVAKQERYNSAGDSLKEHTLFTYNESGVLTEEQYFKGGEPHGKKVFENTFNKFGKPLQMLEYHVDNSGNRVPHNAPMTINEYDDNGRILQTTVYSNKEKRKMLSWIYYKYQVDSDYKVIKRYGYDEEQKEISRVEIEYSENGINYEFYEICDCPAKSLDLKLKNAQSYNSFGELVKEEIRNVSNKLIETITYTYDDFGNLTEKLITNAKDATKIKKERFIYEFAAEQAKK